MHSDDFAQRKLQGILSRIATLETSEFPHPHSAELLRHIRSVFEADFEDIRSSRPNLVTYNCALAQRDIERYIVILGFILRSTNVRNAFEFHEPLLRLATQLLRSKVKLILSSEWDFSPLTYLLYDFELPEFVLIGLPAQESSSPLVLPVAGHELGHHLWHREHLNAETLPLVVESFMCVNDPTQDDPRGSKVGKLEEIQALNLYSTEIECAQRQCEEIFCDFVGIRLFGISFLHAFHYLLSPNVEEKQHPEYPPLEQRAKMHRDALNEYFGLDAPEGYIDDFKEIFPSTSTDEYLEKINLTTRNLLEYLRDKAKSLVDLSGISSPSSDDAIEIYNKYLQHHSPVAKCKGLSEIINAGWIARLNPELWSGVKFKGNKWNILDDIILKSIEVLEFEEKAKR